MQASDGIASARDAVDSLLNLLLPSTGAIQCFARHCARTVWLSLCCSTYMTHARTPLTHTHAHAHMQWLRTMTLDTGVIGFSGGVNTASLPPGAPRAFVWRDNASHTDILATVHPHGYGGIAKSDCIVIAGKQPETREWQRKRRREGGRENGWATWLGKEGVDVCSISFLSQWYHMCCPPPKTPPTKTKTKPNKLQHRVQRV